ncbi:MAG: acyl-CoA thioesterase [Actinomycetota bacterium]|nr:acyl-CoA thioesterase [Actinomycetota bacterium]
MTDMVFELAVPVRYLEVDQQGVVFNMWYLAWFDEALTAFLAARGLTYAALMAAGHDMQLVHTGVDWHGGVRYGDAVRVAVSTARIGRASYTVDFQVRRDDEAVVDARTVYVNVALDGSGARPIPPELLAALGEPQPLRPV